MHEVGLVVPSVSQKSLPLFGRSLQNSIFPRDSDVHAHPMWHDGDVVANEFLP